MTQIGCSKEEYRLFFSKDSKYESISPSFYRRLTDYVLTEVVSEAVKT